MLEFTGLWMVCLVLNVGLGAAAIVLLRHAAGVFVSAYAPRPGSAPYTAAKHAITGLTKTAALDGRKYDIAVGQIDVGNAMTDMAARMADGVPQADGSVRPEPLMDVQHVADAVVHMASLPLDANILFLTVMATKMPFVGRG